MKSVYLDSETVGFTGPVCLFQYGYNLDGEIILHDVFKKPVSETLELLREFTRCCVKGFNLTFDWFHVVKTYNILMEFKDHSKPPSPKEYADIEAKNPSQWCLKPAGIMDFMLYCQEGPYQWLMDRKNITVRFVHKSIAAELKDYLVGSIKFRSALNATWTVEEAPEHATPEEFRNIKLKFKPRRNLETIAQDVLGQGKAESTFKSLKKPIEEGWKPYCHGGWEEGKRRGEWPSVWDQWYHHWSTDKKAREYAWKDVWLLRELDKNWGYPTPSGTNHILAACCAATRWRGYAIDTGLLSEEKKKLDELIDDFPININSPKQVLGFIKKDLPPMEAMVLTSSNKHVLKKLADDGYENAKLVLRSRQAAWTRNFLEKLDCGVFHASNKIIGALSNRMSGSDKLNPQGIPKTIRYFFTMAFLGEVLSGGDFKSFEITIADAVYNDPELRALLLSGKKVHGLFGEEFYDASYDEIVSTADGDYCYKCLGSGKSSDIVNVDEEDGEDIFSEDCPDCLGTGVNDIYTKSKGGFFGYIYGAQEKKTAETLGLPEEQVSEGFKKLERRFIGLGKHKAKIFEMFCSMRQPGGIGSNIEWHDPAEYIEGLLGFKRYFTLENRVCKALFDISSKLPKNIKKFTKTIQRRPGRNQSISGAAQTALFAAAFNIQSTNMRAAGNHEIQNTGADITKEVQVEVWKEQPIGVSLWIVRPLNIHDELQNVTNGLDVTDKVQNKVQTFVPIVPLIAIDWNHGSKCWKEAKKKDDKVTKGKVTKEIKNGR